MVDNNLVERQFFDNYCREASVVVAGNAIMGIMCKHGQPNLLVAVISQSELYYHSAKLNKLSFKSRTRKV
jgi:hypothetical protein